MANRAKPDLLEQVNQRLAVARVVAYDVETSGLDWRTDHICGHVLTFGPKSDDTYYLPVRHEGGANFDAKRVERELAKATKERPTLRWVTHNGAFDWRFAARVGISVPAVCEDTMVNQALIYEWIPSFSLDSCCRYMRVQEKKGEELYRHLATKFGGEPTRRAQMGNFHKLAGDDPVGVDYAAGDGISTYQLWAAQQDELDLQDLRGAWAIECALIPILNRMMVRGIRIDEEMLERVTKLAKRHIDTLRNQLPKDFNTRAPSQIAKYLRDSGVNDGWPMTAPSQRFPQGQPSYKAEWLETFPAGQAVVAVRKYEHFLDSFLVPLRERHLWNGRVHAEFNQTASDEYGTVTFRFSLSNPNLQQVHKRNKEIGALARSYFVPDRGMVWEDPDYSQIEPRLLAYYSRCKVLLDGYRATPPIDAHTAVTIAANIRFKDGSLDRDTGKRVNQALLTGAGNNKIAEMLVGRSFDEATQIVFDYFDAMPEIKAEQRHSSQVMLARGYVKSFYGYRSRLERRGMEYKALNRLLQVGNAVIIKKKMIEIDGYIQAVASEMAMLNTVHDALAFQYPLGYEPHMAEVLKIMKDCGPGTEFNLDVPIEVETKNGRNWAEATYGRDEVAKQFAKHGVKYDRIRIAA